MLYDEKFEKIYGKITNENIFSIENIRKNAKEVRDSHNRILIIFGIILLLFDFILFIKYKDFFQLILLLILSVNILIPTYVIQSQKDKKNPKISNYNAQYKNKIIQPLIHFFDENLNYLPASRYQSTWIFIC